MYTYIIDILFCLCVSQHFLKHLFYSFRCLCSSSIITLLQLQLLLLLQRDAQLQQLYLCCS